MLGGRKVKPVGLGCMSLSWAYGTPPSDEDGERLLSRALDLGYDQLDTANIYGMGIVLVVLGIAHLAWVIPASVMVTTDTAPATPVEAKA